MALGTALRGIGGGADGGTVKLTADTGEFNAKVEAAERQWRESVSGMSREALRLDLAQQKLRASLAKYGAESAQAKRATIQLKDAEEAAERAANSSTRAYDRQGRELDQLRSRVNAGGRAVGAYRGAVGLLGAALGGVGLTMVLRDSLASFRESETVLGRAEQAVRNAGLEWDRYGKKIDRVIQRQAYLTAFDDEQLLDTFARLVVRTKDVNKALELNALAADVARGRNISLEAATQLVIKASLGQAGQLRRVGIEVDKNATATELLTKLQQAYAGQAVKFANGSAGAQERWNVTLDNAREIIGGGLAPAVDDLTKRARAWLSNQRNQDELQRRVNQAAQTGEKVVRGLAGAIRDISPIIKGTIDALGGIENALKLAFSLALVARIRRIPAAIGLIGPASQRAAATTATSMAAMNAAMTAPLAKVGRLRGAWLALGRLSPVLLATTIAVTFKEEIEDAGNSVLGKFGLGPSKPRTVGDITDLNFNELTRGMPDYARNKIAEQLRAQGYIIRDDGSIVRVRQVGSRSPDDRAGARGPGALGTPPRRPDRSDRRGARDRRLKEFAPMPVSAEVGLERALRTDSPGDEIAIYLREKERIEAQIRRGFKTKAELLEAEQALTQVVREIEQIRDQERDRRAKQRKDAEDRRERRERDERRRTKERERRDERAIDEARRDSRALVARRRAGRMRDLLADAEGDAASRRAVQREIERAEKKADATLTESQVRAAHRDFLQRFGDIATRFAPNFGPGGGGAATAAIAAGIAPPRGAVAETRLYEIVQETRRQNEHLGRLVRKHGFPASEFTDASTLAAFG